MDIDVEQTMFAEIRGGLNGCINAMENASADLGVATVQAQACLEGELFTLGFNTSDASRQIIDSVISNTRSMIGYIDRLEEAVNSYLQCGYKG